MMYRRGHGRRILVISDQDASGLFWAMLLESEEYTVVERATLREAFTELQRRSFHAVVMDLKTGPTKAVLNAQLMEKMWPDTPVIVCLGQKSFKQVSGVDRPPSYFVTKPYDASSLLAYLHQTAKKATWAVSPKYQSHTLETIVRDQTETM